MSDDTPTGTMPERLYASELLTDYRGDERLLLVATEKITEPPGCVPFTIEYVRADQAQVVSLPDPPWKDAPERATHHAYMSNGRGVWLRCEHADPRQGSVLGWYNIMETYVGSGNFVVIYSGVELPLGFDPRTVLQPKPEVKHPAAR
jgi:hypothetical protein